MLYDRQLIIQRLAGQPQGQSASTMFGEYRADCHADITAASEASEKALSSLAA